MKNIDSIKILKATGENAEGIQKVTESSSRGMYQLCGWSEAEIDNHFNVVGGAEKLKKSILNFTEEDILRIKILKFIIKKVANLK